MKKHLFLFLFIPVIYMASGCLGKQEKHEQTTAKSKFSHKLHAGDLKIACTSCHSSSDSTSSTVPPASFCINCHAAEGKQPSPGQQRIMDSLHRSKNINSTDTTH